jgi:hypothetical protein
MSVRLERVSPANKQAALDYLARAPYDNVMISYLLLFDPTPATRNLILVATDGQHVCGVAYFGRQLTLACDEAAIEAFARRARRQGGERSISGPRAAVSAFWELVRGRRSRPRIVRERQLTMVVDRKRLRPYPNATVTRLARPDEWTIVADSSAEMIEGELAYDPRRSAPEFAANIRTMIVQGRWWVGESQGRLCFYCSLAAAKHLDSPRSSRARSRDRLPGADLQHPAEQHPDPLAAR